MRASPGVPRSGNGSDDFVVLVVGGEAVGQLLLDDDLPLGSAEHDRRSDAVQGLFRGRESLLRQDAFERQAERREGREADVGDLVLVARGAVVGDHLEDVAAERGRVDLDEHAAET